MATRGPVDRREIANRTAPASQERYVLRLYVTGASPRSLRAIANLRAICREFLSGRHRLRVIDIYQQAALAAQQQIIATPTLVKESPLPMRRLLGDLSDRAAVLSGLNLPAVADPNSSSAVETEP